MQGIATSVSLLIFDFIFRLGDTTRSGGRAVTLPVGYTMPSSLVAIPCTFIAKTLHFYCMQCCILIAAELRFCLATIAAVSRHYLGFVSIISCHYLASISVLFWFHCNFAIVLQ